MLKLIRQNILEVESGIVVHQVNCRGVMGSGLALSIKNKWPKVFEEYKKAALPLGSAQVVSVTQDLAVCNLHGQEYYGRISRQTSYTAVETALASLKESQEHDVRYAGRDVFFPYLIGCGLGGGDWTIYRALIEKHFPGAFVCVNS